MSTTLPLPVAAAVFRQLAAATRHGLPHVEVTRILAQDFTLGQTGQAVLQGLSAALAKPVALSAAMRQAQPHFTEPVCDWMQRAEQRAALAPSLDALAHDFDIRAQGRSEVRLAMLWPALLVVAILALTVLLTLFVLPAFSAVYADFGVELPAPTRATFAAGRWALNTWWAWVPVLVVLVVALRLRGMPIFVTRSLDAVAGQMTFVHRMRVAAFASRLIALCQTHHADAELLAPALLHLAATAGSARLATAATRLHAELSHGARLSAALACDPVIPKNLSLYAQLGEKLGDMAGPLAQLSDAAQADYREALVRFERGAVLAVYALLAVAVGTLVLAVYLPIFKLGSIV